MRRKFSCNDNLFSCQNEKSFYLAGFIAADGCLQVNRTSYELSIRLSSNDSGHLEVLNDILSSDRPIRHYRNKGSGVSVLRVTSKKIYDDLRCFNVVPKKSLTYTFPEWVANHSLRSHFMRGYFDGDGSFYIQKQYRPKICFGLRGTPEFLAVYRDILEKECKFSHREYGIPVSGNCGQLNYGGNKNVFKIASFLYGDSTVFLNRKREVVTQALQLGAK